MFTKSLLLWLMARALMLVDGFILLRNVMVINIFGTFETKSGNINGFIAESFMCIVCPFLSSLNGTAYIT